MNVVGAGPSMLARRSDVSQQGLRNTEKKITQLNSSVVLIVVSCSLFGRKSIRPPAALSYLHYGAAKLEKRDRKLTRATSLEFGADNKAIVAESKILAKTKYNEMSDKTKFSDRTKLQK